MSYYQWKGCPVLKGWPGLPTNSSGHTHFWISQISLAIQPPGLDCLSICLSSFHPTLNSSTWEFLSLHPKPNSQIPSSPSRWVLFLFLPVDLCGCEFLFWLHTHSWFPALSFSGPWRRGQQCCGLGLCSDWLAFSVALLFRPASSCWLNGPHTGTGPAWSNTELS